MSVTTSDLITLAPELATVDVAILNSALEAVPLMVRLEVFPENAELLTKYLALHVLALMGFGKAKDGRIVSKSAAGVSVTYATTVATAMDSLGSTPWGVLYRLAVRRYGLRGGVA